MRHFIRNAGRKSVGRAIAIAISGTMAALTANQANAQTYTIVNGGYHAQVTDHWCAAASMEMMLDVPAVYNNNTFVKNLLTAGDGPTIPSGGGDPAPTLGVVGGMPNQVTAGGQAFIYGLVHGTNTVNNFGYSNPFTPVGAGTANAGVVTGLNLLDNPTANVNPAIPAAGFGTHAYQGYNLAPTLLGAALATRTIANSLKDYGVPAQATVESGAHSICVYGVSTNGTPGANQNYTINGVYIHDPWTGYAYSQALAGNLAPASTSWGLGWNTYLRFGYDIRAGGAVTQLPNGVVAPARLGAWFNYFNPSGPQGGPGSSTFGYPGMKFTVDPQGPELPDTGDPAGDNGLSLTEPTESAEMGASTADADATSDLAADSTLDSEPGLTGGHFDMSDEMLKSMQGDISGQEGDWLVPYDGAGGINDVTGAIMIDADTGVIDEATWIDPATDGTSSITLADLDQMFADEAIGQLPNDNAVPEPASVGILFASGAMLCLRRRAKLMK